MHKYPASLLCDFYKVSHREQYPEKTESVYSTWTPRASRKEGIKRVVAFGFQGFIKEFLVDYFHVNFFSVPKWKIVYEYKRVLQHALGIKNPCAKHIEELHDLGYLPLEIRAVKEGTLVPLRVPMLTIRNTNPKFYWVTNYLETIMSLCLWQPSTSATIALEYKKILLESARRTNSDMLGFVQFQGHDFSMRGMSALFSACTSGAGHLLSFNGTDTIPAILYAENYYNSNIEQELIGTSIPATEHSVMCAYGDEDEFETYKRLITKVYPHGHVSIVSDTWDYFNVLNTHIRKLKPEIMTREGCVVIRPDSGDPVKIICGDPLSNDELERKGTVEILWEIFGGTISKEGFKQLDSHIGAIYGDAITIERCREICERLAAKGFASTNVVYGIGSYTYQYNTRDTFGFALKSTHVVIDGTPRAIFKSPKTDDGTKKSALGCVGVRHDKDGFIELVENLTLEETATLEGNLLEVVYLDGRLIRNEKFADIRQRLLEQI